MKLLFRQRFFSWLDSYDIYDEDGSPIFTVEGKLSWGHCLHILDASGTHIGTVQEKPIAFRPKFELYAYGEYLGCIRQELHLFTPLFTIDCSDWIIEGDLLQRDYAIVSPTQGFVASICKDMFRMTDTYVLDIPDPANALCTLMVVLAIDAAKCH